ncbi:MAG: hypothetical protein ACREB8_08590 [Pseudolabrys sp.]
MPSFVVRALCIAALSAGVLIGQADARWKPEYASAPQTVRDWYQHAELTRKAQMRFPFKSCCEHADVVRTQFRVNRATAGDEWYWLDGETWRRIPDDIVHWGETAPDKQPTLFVYQGHETCFWPGESGI